VADAVEVKLIAFSDDKAVSDFEADIISFVVTFKKDFFKI
jgi:hypothetical protein